MERGDAVHIHVITHASKHTGSRQGARTQNKGRTERLPLHNHSHMLNLGLGAEGRQVCFNGHTVNAE